MMVFPEVEGWWCDADDENTFWCFNQIINGFQLIRACQDGGCKQIKCTTFSTRFLSCEEDDTILAYIEHPQSIRYEIEGKPLPEEYYAYFEFIYDKESLVFNSWFPRDQWLSLKKLTREGSHKNRLESFLNSDYQVINEWEEYDYKFDPSTMAVITKSHIYFTAEGQQYYKIPKSLNKALNDININTFTGVLHLNRKTYIAFSDCRLYYDVSTEEQMAAVGIELVDRITD